MIPVIRADAGALTPKLQKVIHTLEWVRIEEFVGSSRCAEGRPPYERSWPATAYAATAVLGVGA